MKRISLYLLFVLILCVVTFAWSDYCDVPITVEPYPSVGARCSSTDSTCLVSIGKIISYTTYGACSGKSSGCTNYRSCGFFFIEWFKSDLCGECTARMYNDVTMVEVICGGPDANPPYGLCSFNTWAIVDVLCYSSGLDCHGQPCTGRVPAPYRMIVPPGGGNPQQVPIGSTGAQTIVGGRTFHWGTPTYIVPVVTYD